LENRRLYFREVINRPKWGLLTLLEIDVMIVCQVMIWELVSFALAKDVKKIVVFGRDLITEGFEFLRVKGF